MKISNTLSVEQKSQSRDTALFLSLKTFYLLLALLSKNVNCSKLFMLIIKFTDILFIITFLLVARNK
jgi:hypothetical protein